MSNLNYSKLGGSNTSFKEMIQRFGVVTVMNASVYNTADLNVNSWKSLDASGIYSQIVANQAICTLDTLKVANVTEEGPDKTITGGQYNNPLIKFGKSARLEMQDALGNAAAIDALCGGIAESNIPNADFGFDSNTVYGIHFGEDFEGPKTIIGDTFFIHQKTGQQVSAKVVFYQFLPDSLFNLTQDAEGDATVFDMNGDLLTTTIGVHDRAGTLKEHGVFYSIIDDSAITPLYTMNASGLVTLTDPTNYTATLDGTAVASEGATLDAGKAGLLVIFNASSEQVAKTVLVR